MPTEPTDAQIAQVTAELAPIAAQIDASKAQPAAVTQSPASGTELARGRDAWVALGKPAAAYDAAMKADGLKLPEAPAAFQEPLEDATPDAYTPNFVDTTVRNLPTERLANIAKETTTWAAEMKLPADLGTSIIEHIAEIGPRFAESTQSAKEDWLRGQHAIALKTLGSEEAVAAMNAKALAALSIAANNTFGKSLAQSPVFNSFWLARALASHRDKVK